MALFACLTSSIVALWRGKTIDPLPETTAVDCVSTASAADNIQFLEPEMARDWLDCVDSLALCCYGGTYKLALALSTVVEADAFRDLRVIVLPRGQEQGQAGITCAIGGKVETFGQKHILCLVPVFEWNAQSRAKKIAWQNNRAQNVARVTLEAEGKKRAFLPREDATIFYPEKEVAA